LTLWVGAIEAVISDGAIAARRAAGFCIDNFAARWSIAACNGCAATGVTTVENQRNLVSWALRCCLATNDFTGTGWSIRGSWDTGIAAVTFFIGLALFVDATRAGRYDALAVGFELWVELAKSAICAIVVVITIGWDHRWRIDWIDFVTFLPTSPHVTKGFAVFVGWLMVVFNN